MEYLGVHPLSETPCSKVPEAQGEKAIEYVDIACEALRKEGGIIHYYEFTNAPNPLEAAKNRFNEAMKQTGRSLRKILLARIVRAIAPYTWQVVVDAEIR